MEVHFIDVGCGNMVPIISPDGRVFMCDCNITDENKERVLSYVRKVIGQGKGINVFINTHRDADHMRGIKDLHAAHPISIIWETGVAGTTPDSPEYEAYMDLKRTVASVELKPRTSGNYGGVVLEVMNSQWDDYSDANEQSLVIRVEYKNESVMLTGDTNFRPWKEKILPYYSGEKLKSSILLAPHHGSIDFFDDPSDTQYYYEEHMKRMKPAMTLVSVGPNIHGLPNGKALELYAKHSTGSSQGNKVFTTEENGTMKLVLKDDGGWSLSANQ